MSRAKWKGPYIDSNILIKKISKNKHITTNSRNTTIIPKFVGLNFKIHNGKSFINLLITEKMIGHKLGEFIPTKKKFSFKKKKLK